MKNLEQPRTKTLISLLFFCFLFLKNSPAQHATDPKYGNFYNMKEKWMEEEEKESFLKELFDKKTEKEAGEIEMEEEGSFFRRWASFVEPRVFPSGDFPKSTILLEELNNYNKKMAMEKLDCTPMGNWQSIQRYNYSVTGTGMVHCLAFHPKHKTTVTPANSYTMFAGAPSGGLWKTTNSGQNWTPLTDKIPAIGVSDIAISPKNPDVIYIATGDKSRGDWYGNLFSYGVMKTTNGGLTWQQTGLSFDFLGNQASINRLIINPDHPDTLIAAVSDAPFSQTVGQGIYRTNNGGVTWARLVVGSFYDLEFHPTNSNIVYACGANGSFFRSTDGGATWGQNIANTDPVLSPVHTATIHPRPLIAITSPNEPDVVYMAYEVDYALRGLYRSTDQGQHWDSIPSNRAGIDGGHSGGYCFAFAVAPRKKNGKDVIAVGFLGIATSSDGGSTWVKPGWSLTHCDQRTLDFLPKTNSDTPFELFNTTDGGIWKIPNADVASLSAEPLNNGLEVLQFFRMGSSATDPSMICSGAQDNGNYVYKSGNTALVNVCDGAEAVVDHHNADVIYVSAANGWVKKYKADGTLIRTVVGNDEWNYFAPFIMHPYDNSILYFARQGNVFKTTNGGVSTFSISTGLTNNSFDKELRTIAVAPSNPDNIIYTTTWTNVYRTINGGATWEDITNGLPTVAGIDHSSISYIIVHPTNPNIVWITMTGFVEGRKVFKTTNGTSPTPEWTNVTGNLPNIPVNCIVYQNNSPDALYVGTDIGVFYTDTLKKYWTSYQNSLPNTAVMELEIQYGVNKLRAATFGRGLWQSDLYNPQKPKPRPTAAFMGSQLTITTGSSVNFTDQSSNSPIYWKWTLPGGSPSVSASQNVSVTYNTPGNYNVKLEVFNVFGGDSLIKTAYIMVTPFQGKEKQNWYFGQTAGLSFVSGSPTADINGAMSAAEGTACMSDKNTGELLLYTNGQMLWNKNHTVMTNGSGLLGSPTSTQSAMIVPKPGSNSIYYVFSIGDVSPNQGISYSMVDMSLNQGLGGVTTKTVTIWNQTSEKIAVVKHSNLSNYWYIFHTWGDNRFFSGLITATNNITQDITGPYYIGWSETGSAPDLRAGQMKASPDGRHIVYISGVGNNLGLFDFNNSTGVISNYRDLSFGTRAYGCSFSPNSQLLYVGEHDAGKKIWQYDLNAGNIATSRISITSPMKLGSFQLGPDDKIYIGDYGNGTSIGVINNPDVRGAGCGYAGSCISLAGRSDALGSLPNFIDADGSHFTYGAYSEGGISETGIDTMKIISETETDTIKNGFTSDNIIKINKKTGALTFSEIKEIVSSSKKDTSSSALSVQDIESGTELKCFPNPFSSSTTISYNLTKSSTVSLSVYDQLGRKTETILEDTRQEQGLKNYPYANNTLPGGIYYVKLQLDGVVHVQKIILIK